MSNWISIKDQLPKNGEPVYIYGAFLQRGFIPARGMLDDDEPVITGFRCGVFPAVCHYGDIPDSETFDRYSKEFIADSDFEDFISGLTLRDLRMYLCCFKHFRAIVDSKTFLYFRGEDFSIPVIVTHWMSRSLPEPPLVDNLDKCFHLIPRLSF
jgi:hypothetical protein